MNVIRVILADDHTVVRQGLRALLEAEPDMAVVAEAGTGRQAVLLTQKLKPHVVVMDIAMPLLNGLEATRQIRKRVPGARVLILSSYSDDEYVHQLSEAGAAGYQLKETAATELIKGIREVRRDQAFFSPAISRQLLDHYRQVVHSSLPKQNGSAILTERETEVLQLIAEGRSSKLIATDVGISVKTVQKHRQNVMDKLNIHDVAGLTRYAIAKGIIRSQYELRTENRSEPG